MHPSQENIQELLNLYSSKEFKLAEIKILITYDE